MSRSLHETSIAAVSASPSSTSTTAAVVDHVLERLAANGVAVRHIRLRELPAGALVAARTDDAGIARAIETVNAADGLIIATPIYKAAYSGLLKLFLDLLPQFALAGKTVLPLATGGTLAHALALDYGLRPVLQSMGVRHVVQGLFIPSASISDAGGAMSFDEPIAVALNEAVHHLRCSVTGDVADRLLGHPRPAREKELL